MMKTFKQLCVGDTLYKVYTNYEAKEKPIFRKIEVRKIEIIKYKNEKNFLVINNRDDFNRYNDFELLLELVDIDFVESKDGFFTTDVNKVKEGIKSTGLKFINEYVGNIEDFHTKIADIRKAYFEYLNIIT